MADISRLVRLDGGINKSFDLSANTLVMQSLKLGAQELTNAQLATLLGGASSDASTLHNHDTQYHTKAILASITTGQGASLIGVEDSGANFTGATVEAVLAELQANINAIAGDTDFADDTFRISDEGDASKKIAFQASGISAATVRTITMPDADVDLGDIASLQTLSGVAAGATDLGAFTGSVITDNSTLKVAIQELEVYAENSRSLIQNFEWKDSALDYVTDNTLVPASENSGDRYILSHDGGAPNAAWDGASAGDIVEFDGTNWVATTPSTGSFISADDESGVLYYWGGASWETKAFEATTAGVGLTKTGFEIALASSVAGDGLGFAAGVLSVNVDDATVELDSDTLRVKDGGIVEAKIGAGAVTNAKIGPDAVDGAKIADDAVGPEHLAAGVAGFGLEQATDGSLDSTGNFITLTNNTGSALSIGQTVNINDSGEIQLLDASALDTCESPAGIVAEAIADAASGRVQVSGLVTGLSSLTPGKRVYASETAGALTMTAPSAVNSCVVLMGNAISATSMILNISFEAVTES
jgi:hypothetical protein